MACIHKSHLLTSICLNSYYFPARCLRHLTERKKSNFTLTLKLQVAGDRRLSESTTLTPSPSVFPKWQPILYV